MDIKEFLLNYRQAFAARLHCLCSSAINTKRLQKWLFGRIID